LKALERVTPANGHDLEANLAKNIGIEYHAPIKYECGLFHRVVNGGPVQGLELAPLCGDDNRIAVLCSG